MSACDTASGSRPTSTSARARNARTASSSSSDPDSSSSVSSSTLSSAPPTFRSELASWITARRRRATARGRVRAPPGRAGTARSGRGRSESRTHARSKLASALSAGQLGGERLDQRPVLVVGPLVERRPGRRDALLPVRVRRHARRAPSRVATRGGTTSRSTARAASRRGSRSAAFSATIIVGA